MYEGENGIFLDEGVGDCRGTVYVGVLDVVVYCTKICLAYAGKICFYVIVDVHDTDVD